MFRAYGVNDKLGNYSLRKSVLINVLPLAASMA